MSRRTFLVTGATGDTGGATVEQMLARGHHVRALAHRQDDRAKRLQGLGTEVVFGDFRGEGTTVTMRIPLRKRLGVNLARIAESYHLGGQRTVA